MKLYKDGTIEGTPEEITEYIRINSISMQEPLNEKEFEKQFLNSTGSGKVGLGNKFFCRDCGFYSCRCS